MKHQDPVDLIRERNPVPDAHQLPDGPNSASAEALKEEIIGMERKKTEHTGRPRVGRATTLAAAAVVLVLVGTAWALVVQPEQSTRIQCPGNAIIAAVSGDPVADCENALQADGIDPGEMTAFVNPQGGVVVVRDGQPIETGLTPLTKEFQQDVAIIELEAAIGDVSTGLGGGCYTSDQAATIVDRELNRLGLEWRIEIRDSADGVGSCAWAFPEPEISRVVVAAIDGEPPSGEEPWTVLGTRLNEELTKTCHTLTGAAQTVESIAAEVGLDFDVQIRMTSTADEQAGCTRATVTVGGAIFVDLRGPSK